MKGKERVSEVKMAFDGCGSFGTAGVIFAHGLKIQCRQVVDRVHDIIASGLYGSITLNILGLSRGGCAASFLINMLKSYPKSVLKINAVLIDPVPGNLILSSNLDYLFSLTTANDAKDVSASMNLDKVLALYPYEPLPDLAFHAPLLLKYPVHTVVEEMAVLGCHQGAIFVSDELGAIANHRLIFTFLTENGSTFGPQPSYTAVSDDLLLDGFNSELGGPAAPSRRTGHNSCFMFSALITREGSAAFVNKQHEALANRLGRRPPQPFNPQNKYLLNIKRSATIHVPTAMVIVSSLSLIISLIVVNL